MIRVVLADDLALVRGGMRVILEAEPDPNGGWRVCAELPLEADPDAAAIAGTQRSLAT